MKPRIKDIFVAAIISVVMCGFLSTAATAQQEQPIHERFDQGWQRAQRMLDGVLTPPQHSELNLIAYSAAAASLCEGFSLDRDKFADGMKQLEHQDLASMSAEEVVYFERHLLFNYGVAVGLFLAEGSSDQTGFCQEATEHRSDPETYNYWR